MSELSPDPITGNVTIDPVLGRHYNADPWRGGRIPADMEPYALSNGSYVPLITDAETLPTLDEINSLMQTAERRDAEVVAKITETISQDEFDRRVKQLYREHPQFVDGVQMWLADYLDRKYKDLNVLDVSDPSFKDDLKALVEAMYVANQHGNEHLGVVDIEFLIIDALEKIEGFKQEIAREMLVHEHHLLSEEDIARFVAKLDTELESLSDSPLVSA